ncbi:hypothetical protein D6158_24025 [Nocardia seriolae]|nr:hypothetical protein C6575_24695 [Nocardia seriolae]RLP29439.1 hypothetical protein D6158_24025 [Nocardia seriolae]
MVQGHGGEGPLGRAEEVQGHIAPAHAHESGQIGDAQRLPQRPHGNRVPLFQQGAGVARHLAHPDTARPRQHPIQRARIAAGGRSPENHTETLIRPAGPRRGVDAARGRIIDAHKVAELVRTSW